MELWRVRKEYRQLAVKLRKAVGSQPVVVSGAEADVLLVLCNGERLETELAVLNHTRRSARARLRRMRVLLENAGVLKDHVTSALVRRSDTVAALELDAALTNRGCSEVATVLKQVRGELEHLERRIEEVAARLERLSSTSRVLLARLLGALNLTGYVHTPPEWPVR